MNTMTLRHVLRLTICTFVLFALYFYLAGYKENIPIYMEYMRGIITLGYCSVIYMSMNRNISRNLFFTYLFISFYLLSALLQFSTFCATNTLFGEDGVDCYRYIYYGINYSSLSLFDFYEKVLTVDGHCRLDDLGFYTVIHYSSRLFGRDAVSIAYFLVLFNSIMHIVGAYYFYRLCVMTLNDKWHARLATGLWIGFSTLIITNAGGVKEVIFTAVIVIAMYCIYKYKEWPTIGNLLQALFFIGLCLLSCNYPAIRTQKKCGLEVESTFYAWRFGKRKYITFREKSKKNG